MAGVCDHAAAMANLGGIDLGGTKIQAAVVERDHEVLGQARRPTPTSGGPADVAGEMERALARSGQGGGGRGGGARGHRASALPGPIEDGKVTSARNLPDGKAASRWPTRSRRRSDRAVKIGNDVQVATLAEVELGAGKQFSSMLGVFWGTGVGGGVILDGKPWNGRGGGRGDRPHGRGARTAHAAVRAAWLHGGLRGALGDGSARQKLVEKGSKTDLFKIMKDHDRTRLTSGIWAHALEHGDELATHLIERACARWARASHRR